jgi:hypothetical protein
MAVAHNRLPCLRRSLCLATTPRRVATLFKIRNRNTEKGQSIRPDPIPFHDCADQFSAMRKSGKMPGSTT